MSDNNQSTNEQNEKKSSLSKPGEGQQQNSAGKTDADEISEDEANKPQPNVILDKVSGGGSRATSYHDTERVSPRANEASDQKDTNTGGMISGGAKGTSQS